MTPSMGRQYDPLEELDALETPSTAKSAADAKKTTEKTAEKKPANSGGSWFGGLFSKLAPKPKNQMILPDDSNPTVRICHCAVSSSSSLKNYDGRFYVLCRKGLARILLVIECYLWLQQCL